MNKSVLLEFIVVTLIISELRSLYCINYYQFFHHALIICDVYDV